MIITEDQRDYLGSRFEQLYSLYVSSTFEFPYGLPGWKAFMDMEKLCSKLCRLNRIAPLSKSRDDAKLQWENLLMKLSRSDDSEDNLVYIVRAIPAIVAKMKADHVYNS